MKRYSIFIICALLIAFASCIKEDKLLTIDEHARDALYKIMNENYLWYDLMPKVKKEYYADPYELLEAMRYRELDRWSFIMDYDEFIQQNNAIFVGHGIRLGLAEDNTVRIAQVYEKSQLYEYGVRRGWIIKRLNAFELAPIFINNDVAFYNILMGPSEAGVTNQFLFETPEGKDSVIIATKSIFTANTVIHCDTLHLKTGITGHLVFEQFVSPSNAELETAFAFFRRNNINNIIVDLRYNGGGSISVLQNLAAHIAGPSKFGQPFLTLTYNDLQKTSNEIIKFGSVNSSINVEKMIVITTRGTASASEDFINGLKPFIDITTVGDVTNGKPVGMEVFRYEKEYVFAPITFTLVNTDNEGDFYGGFSPAKYAPDDITRDWNDRNEACLNEAIYILENGSVSPTRSEYNSGKPVILYDELKKPNGAYLIYK